MKRVLLCLSAILFLAGCDTEWSFSTTFGEKEPASTPFELNDRPYEWRLFSLPASTSLFLSRMDGAGNGKIVFGAACTGFDHGSMTLRFGGLADGRLAMEAGDKAFSVDARRRENKGHVSVSGQGYLPDGWLDALGAAERIVISHGQDRWAFAGPGEDLTAAFARLCRSKA